MGIYLAKLDSGTHPVLDTAAHATRVWRPLPVFRSTEWWAPICILLTSLEWSLRSVRRETNTHDDTHDNDLNTS